jgi:cell wall-associated NlpC family hydrolase
MAGCVSTGEIGASAPAAVGDRAVAIALSQVGVPYRYGGAGPAGFDCSGLVHYAYGKAGKRLPRTTGELWDHATPVKGDRMRAGDLLFFRFDGKMSHVGMYVGDGHFVHAPSSGKRVSVERLASPVYGEAFIRAARP